jgi:hypothetical protein
MRSFLIALVGLALLCGGAYASVPDPGRCSVNPPDLMESKRIFGIPATAGVAAANLDIYIRDSNGAPIGNAYVEVILNPGCAVGSPPSPICTCNNWVRTGYTSASGFLRLNMKFGGCCTAVSSIIINAEYTPIRGYDIIVSPDFDGVRGNCRVELADFVYFSGRYGQINACLSYNGDAADRVELADFVAFAGAYGKNCTH